MGWLHQPVWKLGHVLIHWAGWLKNWGWLIGIVSGSGCCLYLFILQIVPHALKLPPETRFLSCWSKLLACYFQSQCGLYWQAFGPCAGFGSGYFLFCRQ